MAAEPRAAILTSGPPAIRKACSRPTKCCVVGAGAKYELPKYVLSAPTNLLKDDPDALTAPRDIEMQESR